MVFVNTRALSRSHKATENQSNMMTVDKEGIYLGHGTTLCGDNKAMFPMQYFTDYIVLKVNAIVTEIDRRKDLDL